MAEVMTYGTLVADIVSYAERGQDANFIAQVPRFIALAENRIATEVRGLGFKKVVSSAFVSGEPVIPKPVRWRETVSWNYGTGTANNVRNLLLPRSYEYCRTFWPDDSVTGLPRFYADYNYDNFLVVGTPADAYPFELVYHERPVPLDGTVQENWTTRYAPQLILFAALLETAPWLKLDERVQVWQAAYDRARTGVQGEDEARQVDHSVVRKRA